jgi:hypothetical protein
MVRTEVHHFAFALVTAFLVRGEGMYALIAALFGERPEGRTGLRMALACVR